MTYPKDGKDTPQTGWHPGTVSCADIKAAVCQAFDVRPSDMTSPIRERRIARPRQVAMFLCRDLTSYSLPRLGAMFGGRDHSTIVHGVQQVKRRMSEDHKFKDKIETLRARLVSANEQAS